MASTDSHQQFAEPSLELSRHGSRRLRQRAIPARAVDLVLEYGVRQRSHGATRVFLDRAGRSRLERREGLSVIRELGHKLDIYLVVGDDETLVTAAYRTRSIHH